MITMYRVEDISPSAFKPRFIVADRAAGAYDGTYDNMTTAYSRAARLNGKPLGRLSYRARTQKIVEVYGLTADHDEEDALKVALEVAGETKSSLFGYRVSLYGSRAIVSLDTD